MNIDDIGTSIYRAAGLSPIVTPAGGTAELAANIFGNSIIRLQPHALLEGTVATLGGRRRIVIRDGLEPTGLNFAVGKQLARLVLGLDGSEDECRAVAAWLVAPPEAFRAQMRAGLGIDSLGSHFTMSPTSAAIRIPEVGGPDAVVVTPLRVHRRGKLLAGFGDADVRALAAKRHLRSLRREVVRANPQCVALFAA